MVVAADDGEESEYAALMTAADASAELLAGLPDGERRRVVVVAETATADGPVRWRDVVAVHVDTEDDAGRRRRPRVVRHPGDRRPVARPDSASGSPLTPASAV